MKPGATSGSGRFAFALPRWTFLAVSLGLVALLQSACTTGPAADTTFPPTQDAESHPSDVPSVGLFERIAELAARWDREPLSLGTQKQVFYDDAIVASKVNIVRRMGSVKKLNGGRPVLEATEKWETPDQRRGVGAYCSVLRGDDGIFQAWYACGQKDAQGTAQEIGYAESSDGLHWRKPRRGPVLTWAHGHGVVLDRHETRPDHHYKMAYGDGRDWRPPLFFAHSADGVRWKRYGRADELDATYQLRVDTQSSLFWDENLSAYRIFTRDRLGNPRGIRQFVKPAFGGLIGPLAPWFDDRSAVISVQDEKLPTGDNSYSFSVHPSQGLYIGKMNFYRDSMHYCIALSRDGLKWDWRWIGVTNELIPFGPPGAFDSSAIWGAATPFIEMGDELWIYYAGMTRPYSFAQVAPPAGSSEPHLTAIGVASMRLDGLFYLEPMGVSGVVETKSFVWTGHAIEVNADASLGEIRVELLDPAGSPLPGFSGDACDRLMTDGIHVHATWSGRSDLSSLIGKTLKLRFRLTGPVKLYAFQAVTL